METNPFSACSVFLYTTKAQLHFSKQLNKTLELIWFDQSLTSIWMVLWQFLRIKPLYDSEKNAINLNITPEREVAGYGLQI